MLPTDQYEKTIINKYTLALNHLMRLLCQFQTDKAKHIF